MKPETGNIIVTRINYVFNLNYIHTHIFFSSGPVYIAIFEFSCGHHEQVPIVTEWRGGGHGGRGGRNQDEREGGGDFQLFTLNKHGARD